jgi:hypothetical protein
VMATAMVHLLLLSESDDEWKCSIRFLLRLLNPRIYLLKNRHPLRSL